MRIDFHMLDDNTMSFALNNRIYTLHRVWPYPESRQQRPNR